MPLFEFVCRNCGHRFETLVTASRAAACPSCRSSILEKQASVFGARASGQRASSTPASSRFT